MQLEQPVGGVTGEMGEDGNGPGEVEGPVLERERRLDAALDGVERRAEVLPQPLDARPVDVGAPDLAPLGLRDEVTQRAARAAAEVEDALARQVGAGGQKAQQFALRVSPGRVVAGTGFGLVLGQAEDPVHERQRWKRERVPLPHQSSSAILGASRLKNQTDQMQTPTKTIAAGSRCSHPPATSTTDGALGSMIHLWA